MIIGLFHKKSTQGGLKIYFFEKKKKLWHFQAYHFALENSWQKKVLPMKIVLHPLEILRPKMSTYCMVLSMIFSSSILEIPFLFQLNPVISMWYFFNINENSMPALYLSISLSVYLSIIYIYIYICIYISIYIYIYIYK